MLIKEEIQVNKGPHTFVEWSDEEGLLLRTRMEKAYQNLAEQVVTNVRINLDKLPSKYHMFLH